MNEDVADLKSSTLVAIVVICMIGIAVPAGAEPISAPIAEQAIGNSTGIGKGAETAENPATAFSDADDLKNNSTETKPGQAILLRDRQSPSSPSIRPERLVIAPGSLGNPPSGSQASPTTDDESWNLHRELKEAVRPLYEDLKAAGVVEAVRSLKADLGLGSSSPSDSRAGSGYPKNSADAAPQDRQRSAAQIERDRLIAAAMWDEFVAEVKPWLYGVTGLFVLGYMIKLGVDYLQWKAMRSIKRGSRGMRHHRHPKGAKHRDGA